MVASDAENEKEVERQLELMAEGALDFYGREDLRPRLAEALREGRPLRVKLGMDPSAPDLHLGHTVVLDKLRRFQELGHTPIFLVGDFTARIGDPSGRSKVRKPLEEEEVQANARTYAEQVGCILTLEGAEIRFNSEWMKALTPSDFIRLCSRSTLARLLERDDFATRLEERVPIFAHELLYPFVQAYDSVALEADVELGGSDQTFNMLMAREIQRSYGQPPQAVLTHPLLVGTDGQEKMSKSLGNYVGVAEPPEEIFGKVMSISDSLLSGWISVLSLGEWADLEADSAAVTRGGGDPMALKKEVAARIVERFAGPEGARTAAEHFRQVVQSRQAPDDAPRESLDLAGEDAIGLLEVLERLSLTKSRSEARRLAGQGAVSIDGERILDATHRLEPGTYLLRVGRRRFTRVTIR